MTEQEQAANEAQGQQGPQVQLQKIFLKDASVEVPSAPGVFTKAFKPKVDVNLNTEVKDLGNGAHMVTLMVTVTAKQEDNVAYLVEVQTSGVMTIGASTQGAQRQAILGAWAPNTIFPYVRQTVSDLIQQAGFPPFYLQPVNFEALFKEYLESQAREAQGAEGATAH